MRHGRSLMVGLQISTAAGTTDRDGLDLDKLAWVAQDRHTKQRARRVMITEETGDLIPGGNQILADTAGDIDGRLDHIRDRRPGLFQGDLQILQSLTHLRPDVRWGNDLAVLIERAGTCGKDQIGPVSPGGVGIRGAGEQPGAADKLHGHGNEVCHTAANFRPGIMITKP
jgi:hypothetical protein